MLRASHDGGDTFGAPHAVADSTVAVYSPQLLVHDPVVPREQALLLDLEQVPDLAIRRALKPAQLPAPALDYLQPPHIYAYFFARALSGV